SVELFTSLEGHHRPDAQCGPSTFTDLINSGQTAYGNLEVLNDGKNVYLLVNMNTGWLLKGLKVFAGDVANLPRGNGGNIEIEEFPYQVLHNRLMQKYTYVFPKGNLPVCSDIAVFAQVAQVDFFGNVQGNMNLWADGTQSSDGYTFNHCAGVCPSMNATNNSSIVE
ncbi:MAG: hypothetical protein AAF570_28505, partial [Bacteroidota bacterium]